MSELNELKRLGMSLQAIRAITGHGRKTIRKYLGKEPGRCQPTGRGRRGRAKWNAVVLLRELRERGYTGAYTILTDYLRPLREAARQVAVRRFETAPDVQAQVDWGHLGYLEDAVGEQAISGFTFTLGYSRAPAEDLQQGRLQPSTLNRRAADSRAANATLRP